MKIIIALLTVLSLTACEGGSSGEPTPTSAVPITHQPTVPDEPLLPEAGRPDATDPSVVVGPEPSTPDVGNQPVASPTPDPGVPASTPSPTPGPNAQTVSVTIYSKTLTEAPITGWVTKTYTSKGSCFEYQNSTYCWDDGVHTLSWVSNHFQYGGKYTYWNLETDTSDWNVCHGGCDTSYLSQPMKINAQLRTAIINASGAVSGNSNPSAIDDIFDDGTSVSVSCSDDGVTLTCPDFTVTL